MVWRGSINLPPAFLDEKTQRVEIDWGCTMSEAAQVYREIKEELRRLLEESNGVNDIKNNG